MKRLFFILVMVLASIGFTSCDDHKSEPKLVDTNEYYVKYSIKSPGGSYYYFSDIYYADVSGTKSTNISYSVKSWNVTIGPVKKGFKASVKNEKGTGNNQIEVSKNGAPFALKAEGRNSATYTIDF